MYVCINSFVVSCCWR